MTKAIIIAGGKGSRLNKYTENTPKCMLEFGEKSLLERQIETFNACGIEEIVVLKGHLSEKIKSKGITRSYVDPPWVKNMVNALMASENELVDSKETIISYGDIIFDKKTLKKVVDCKKDICVATDDGWKDYWSSRFGGHLEDLESLQIGKRGYIDELGTPDCEVEDCHSRYVGLIKFSEKGSKILTEVYHENKKKYWESPDRWLNSKSFKEAYMTDMLQAIINKGYDIWPVRVKGGWLEFDTNEDYEKATEWLKKGAISKFIDLGNEK